MIIKALQSSDDMTPRVKRTVENPNVGKSNTVFYTYIHTSNVELVSTKFSPCTRSIVDLKSTWYYSALCWLPLESCHLMTAFKLWKLEIFWKLSLGQTVEIHKNNLDCKLKIYDKLQYYRYYTRVRNGNCIPLDPKIVTNDDVPNEPSCQLGVKNRS